MTLDGGGNGRMYFRLFDENKRFSPEQLQAFLHKLGIVQDGESFNAPNLLFLSPPGTSNRKGFIKEFHQKFFAWHPTLRLLHLETGDNSDIEHNLPKTVMTFLPKLKSRRSRSFFLINKFELAAMSLGIVAFFCVYSFLSDMSHSAEPFQVFISNINWRLFLLDNVFHNAKYWGPAILIVALRKNIIKKHSPTRDADLVVQHIIEKLEETSYDKVAQGLLNKADGLPFALYIEDLDALTTIDRSILFDHVLKSSRLINSRIQYFLIAFSSVPSEARSQFMNLNEAGGFHIFETFIEEGEILPQAPPSSELNRLIEAFYREHHSDNAQDIKWTFFETFYLYGVTCRLMGDRPIQLFEDHIASYCESALKSPTAILSNLQTLASTSNIVDALKRCCGDFSLHMNTSKIIPRVMIYKEGRHHIDWYTLKEIKSRIPDGLRVSCNVMILDYYRHCLESGKFRHLSVADSHYIVASLLTEIIEIVTSAVNTDVVLWNTLQVLCEHYLELLENSGCDNYSVPICFLLLLCMAKCNTSELTPLYFKAIHNIFVFEKQSSPQFDKFKRSIGTETTVGQLIHSALSNHLRLSIPAILTTSTGTKNAVVDHPRNHFRSWLRLSHFENSDILPSLPILFIDADGFGNVAVTKNKLEVQEDLVVDSFQTGEDYTLRRGFACFR